MDIGVIVIGDELLLGKRRDKHLPAMIERLGARRLRLDWVRIVGDEPARLEATLRDTLGSGDLVISFGGIGATPDDLTRQCAAAAADVALERHPEAAALIEARFGADAYSYRILMADLPAGSRLIPNPVNRIPGFSLRDHHFVPGFPNMAWPMAEWVLDTHYVHLRPSEPEHERRVEVYGVAESTLVPVMRRLLDRFPGVRISSLPSATDRGRIELGVRGETAQMERAFEVLLSELEGLGLRTSAE
jgi:molybdopterin-biosynthesis enzyme MoeA-like protein